MAKGQRRNLEVKFDLTCSKGNTTISGCPLGSVGQWVAQMGGDDLCVEELLYFKEAEFSGFKFTLKPHKDGK